VRPYWRNGKLLTNNALFVKVIGFSYFRIPYTPCSSLQQVVCVTLVESGGSPDGMRMCKLPCFHNPVFKMLRALLKCQASKFDQPDDGDRHNVIENNLPLVTNTERELNEGS